MTGQIYDLGYKRYVGSRLSVDTRWTVIMRHQLSTAWRTWWRFKIWLIAALLLTGAEASVMYFLREQKFLRIGGIGHTVLSIADGIVPDSAQWFCKIGFLVSMTLTAQLIASDVQSGAFTFYFARSVRPRDYVIGKLAGLAILLSFIMLAGPLVLAGLRLGLADNVDEAIDLLPMLYKTIAMGAVGTLVYAAVPLGFSALFARRSYAISVWAAYYIVVGWMTTGISVVTVPEVAAIDVAAAYKAFSLDLFDVQLNFARLAIPMTAAVISIVLHVGAAIALIGWRVRSAQQTGVGGSS